MFLMSCSHIAFLSCSLVSFLSPPRHALVCLSFVLMSLVLRSLVHTAPTHFTTHFTLLYNALYLALQRTFPHLRLTLYRDIHLNNALCLDNALANQNAAARAQGGVGAHAHWNRLSHQQTSSKIRSRLHWGCSAT